MASEIHRYNVGDIAITVLADGFRVIAPDGFVLNASKEELLATLAEGGFPTDHMRNVYAPVLLQIGGKNVLIDAGNGEATFIQSKGDRGRLLQNLAAAGIGRDAIDVVLVSHFHGDHVNGLLMADGSPTFSNAEIKVPDAEWAFWMDDGEMSRASQGRMAEMFHNNRRIFDGLKRKVTRYGWDEEVLPGVTAVGTPGHSIGHTSFVVSSGTDSVYVQGDVNNQSAVFSRHPEWHGWFDQDPVQASATRRRVYDMLAAEKMPVQAYHHLFPGLGRVEKDGAGFRIVPVM